jgi:hypothetical protein
MRNFQHKAKLSARILHGKGLVPMFYIGELTADAEPEMHFS